MYQQPVIPLAVPTAPKLELKVRRLEQTPTLADVLDRTACLVFVSHGSDCQLDKKKKTT
jgi:hypothetical protein